MIKELLDAFEAVASNQGFDAHAVAAAARTGMLPVATGTTLDGLQLIDDAGAVWIIVGKPPYAGDPVPQTRQHGRAFALFCAASRYPALAHLMPKREDFAHTWTCRTCDGTGKTTKGSAWRVELPDLATLCMDCAGRGWKANPLDAHPNALQTFFAKCWTSDFYDTVGADPRAALAAAGLDPGDVDIELIVGNSVPRDLCYMCQLNLATIELILGECQSGAVVADNSLGSLLQSATDAATATSITEAPRGALAARGLTLTENVRVRARHAGEDGPRCEACGQLRSGLRLIVGHEGHVCCCDVPELWDVIAGMAR